MTIRQKRMINRPLTITRLLVTILFLSLLQTAQAQQVGWATYYAQKLNGARTASGQILDNNAMVCAHPSYPFGTLLSVKNLHNNKVVVVKVIDRGPHIKGYIVDLSYRAATELGMLKHGRVKVEVKPQQQRQQATTAKPQGKKKPVNK